MLAQRLYDLVQETKKVAEEDASVNNLFREIDDELRQDKAAGLWKKYGSTLIAAIVAIIVAVAGFEGWKAYDLSKREDLGSQYALAQALASNNKLDEAEQAFNNLTTSGTGYAVLARLQEASVLAKQGKAKEAAEAYFLLAQNNEVDALFRDMALVLGALNGLDVMEANDIKSQLASLVSGSSPWRHSAKEITAYAEAKLGNVKQAHNLMQELVDDAATPPGVRQRATEFVKAFAG